MSSRDLCGRSSSVESLQRFPSISFVIWFCLFCNCFSSSFGQTHLPSAQGHQVEEHVRRAEPHPGAGEAHGGKRRGQSARREECKRHYRLRGALTILDILECCFLYWLLFWRHIEYKLGSLEIVKMPLYRASFYYVSSIDWIRAASLTKIELD